MDGKLCEPSSVGYEFTCAGCKLAGAKAVYYGETSKGIYLRKSQHEADIRNINLNNAMAKHLQIQHSGIDQGWLVEVSKSFRTPMMRQIHEGVRISLSDADIILNSRNEFHQAPILRVVPVRGLTHTQECKENTTGIQAMSAGKLTEK